MMSHHGLISSAHSAPFASIGDAGGSSVTHYSHIEGEVCITESNLGDRPVSTYLRGGRATVASVHRSLPAKSWLVLPCYLKRDGRFADWQSQIPGKMKEGETPLQAAQREVAEEIGVFLPTSAFVCATSDRGENHYIVDMSAVVSDPTTIRRECEERASRRDDRGRVVVYLYIKEEELARHLPVVQSRSRVESGDSAGKLVFVVPASTVLAMI